jgi:hypothetical protein
MKALTMNTKRVKGEFKNSFYYKQFTIELS